MSRLLRDACLLLPVLCVLGSACTLLLGDYEAAEGGAGGTGVEPGSSTSATTGSASNQSSASTSSASTSSASSTSASASASSTGSSGASSGASSSAGSSSASGGGACSNMVQDGNETDVDCGGGGTCSRCDNGKHCGNFDLNCKSSNCQNNVCISVKFSCTNNMLDGNETDVDCGGTSCPGCLPGRACLVAADCVFNKCSSGACSPP